MTTTDALTWVLDAHLEVTRLYRVAIEREIWHTRRIYSGTLRDDVRRALKASIKDIKIPDYPKPDNRELVALVYNKVPKPNFEKIRQEYLDEINSY